MLGTGLEPARPKGQGILSRLQNTNWKRSEATESKLSIGYEGVHCALLY